MKTTDGTPFTLRPENPNDDNFIFRLFSTVQGAEFSPLALPPAQLNQLLLMQHKARQQSYRWTYPDAEFAIIEIGGEPVGRWVCRHRDGHLLVIDVEVTPEHRNRGIGSALLTDFLARSQSASLHVARHNPAQNLYRRLGFVEVPSAEMMMAMEWKAGQGAE